MKTTVRTLAIVAALALLTWGANEAAAAARPSLAEPPAAVSIEDGAELAATADAAGRHPLAIREHAKIGRPQITLHEPDHSERARAAWHPTRHACDASPDH